MIRALILVALLGHPAAACHTCSLAEGRHLGVAGDGTWAITQGESTGETDYSEIWELTLGRGTRTLCRLTVAVDSQDHFDVGGTRPSLCERVAGVKGGTSRPHRDRALVERKIVAALQLTPVQPIATPPVTFQRHDEEDASLQYKVKLGRRTLGEIWVDEFNEEGYFSGTWAVSAYAHPRHDGLFLRVMTLMMMPRMEWNDGKSCHSGRDVYLAVKP